MESELFYSPNTCAIFFYLYQLVYIEITLTLHLSKRYFNQKFWSSSWCDIWNEIHNHINFPPTVTNLPNTVSDLWHPHSYSWNRSLINQIFDNHATDAFSKIMHVPSDENDTIK